MAGRQTRVWAADAAGIARAVAVLQAGGLVAFPTETVYGLGAHALDPQAVLGIFEAKQRPADDPLIVHLADAEQVDRIAVASGVLRRLAQHFWPGPLTLVVAKRVCVPPQVTAGRDTVAVRVPSHAVAHALLAQSDLPVAAPSANLFGRPSPTRAQHVLDDLDGRIDVVLDGGSSSVGLESTIVDISGSQPRLLRPGGLHAEDIEAALGMRLLGPPGHVLGPQPAPGLLPAHYAPRTPLIYISGPPALARARLRFEVEAALAAGRRVGVLVLDEDRALLPPTIYAEVVGSWSQPALVAARLFEAIRSLDAARLDVLFARELADPSIGLGRALADRLRRAARRVVDIRD